MAVSTIDALYNGGSEKISATSTGVDVTGTLTSDGLTVSAASANIDVSDTGTSFASQDFLTNSNAARTTIGVERAAGGGLFVGSSGYAAVFGSAGAHSTQIASNNTVRMTVDSSGNVGIGTSSPDNNANYKALTIQSTSGSGGGQVYVKSSTATGVLGADNAGTGPKVILQTNTAHPLVFGTNNAERMRIDASGNVLIHRLTPATSAKGVSFTTDANGTILDLGTTYSGFDQMRFRHNGTVVGTINVTASATSYNTSSDYRLKTDAQPMTGASARVQALNPVNFEWLSDGSRVDGFLAHEAQAVVPEAVTGTQDAMRDEEYEATPAVLDDDGNETTAAVMGTRSVPDMQGIDQSKLVPLLTAALQEALTKIDDMETRLAALEG